MQGQIRETSSNSRTCGNQANALAEKNMRDSLAQREQAERTRLTETLVDDIRRWSSGKEGNLRALLSTLQYEKAEAFKMRVDDLKKKEMLLQIAPANALFHNNMLKWIVRAVEVPPEAE